MPFEVENLSEAIRDVKKELRRARVIYSILILEDKF